MYILVVNVNGNRQHMEVFAFANVLLDTLRWRVWPAQVNNSFINGVGVRVTLLNKIIHESLHLCIALLKSDN